MNFFRLNPCLCCILSVPRRRRRGWTGLVHRFNYPRAKAHSVVITNPSLKAGVNTKALRQLYTRSVHHKSQPKGRGNGRMVWTQATGSLVTSNTELSTICRSLTPAFRLGCRHTSTQALALTARNMAFFTPRSYT